LYLLSAIAWLEDLDNLSLLCLRVKVLRVDAGLTGISRK